MQSVDPHDPISFNGPTVSRLIDPRSAETSLDRLGVQPKDALHFATLFESLGDLRGRPVEVGPDLFVVEIEKTHLQPHDVAGAEFGFPHG